MNIPELRLKVKEFQERLNQKELYTILLILVVGFGSFGLGRLSKLQEGKLPIRIEQAGASVLSSPPAHVAGASTERVQGENKGVVVTTTPPQSSPSKGEEVKLASGSRAISPGGQLVASKGGTKYHFPWCSGAQRISEANKIWFNSAEEARKAGYTPASNCKGLK